MMGQGSSRFHKARYSVMSVGILRSGIRMHGKRVDLPSSCSNHRLSVLARPCLVFLLFTMLRACTPRMGRLAGHVVLNREDHPTFPRSGLGFELLLTTTFGLVYERKL